MWELERCGGVQQILKRCHRPRRRHVGLTSFEGGQAVGDPKVTHQPLKTLLLIHLFTPRFKRSWGPKGAPLVPVEPKGQSTATQLP